ncbi:MAG TPA: hypothetical protein VGA73_14200 [Candidatus Binatia bacterium]
MTPHDVSTWRIRFQCKTCGTAFTVKGIPHLEIAEASNETICPTCGVAPDKGTSGLLGFGQRHRIVNISREYPFRKAKNGETWHFNSACSKWPAENYEKADSAPSESELCNECKAAPRF